MNIRELKKILKENKLRSCSYWDKKRLIALANEHDLLPKKSKDSSVYRRGLGPTLKTKLTLH